MDGVKRRRINVAKTAKALRATHMGGVKAKGGAFGAASLAAQERPPLPPTARQDEFRAAIAALTQELGRGPSTGEIAARLGISRDGARAQLRALERKGLIGDVPKTVRSGRWALVGERE